MRRSLIKMHWRCEVVGLCVYMKLHIISNIWHEFYVFSATNPIKDSSSMSRFCFLVFVCVSVCVLQDINHFQFRILSIEEGVTIDCPRSHKYRYTVRTSRHNFPVKKLEHSKRILNRKRLMKYKDMCFEVDLFIQMTVYSFPNMSVYQSGQLIPVADAC